MSKVNELIKEKLKKYPKETQQIITRAIELAELGQKETAISEELDGYIREITKDKNK